MINTFQDQQGLADAVFAQTDCPVFALLDAAACDELLDRLYDDVEPVEFECLYRGEMAPDIAYTAPYIARLLPGSALARWFFANLGRGWGSLAVCAPDTTLALARRHFRKLNVVLGPDGEELVFRYYDPSVLPLLLPVCSPDQLDKLFGIVQAYWFETGDGRGLQRYWLADGKVQKSELAKG